MQFLFRATHAIPLSPRKGNRLGAFLGLLVPDNSASLLSEQRQTDAELFHVEAPAAGTTNNNASVVASARTKEWNFCRILPQQTLLTLSL